MNILETNSSDQKDGSVPARKLGVSHLIGCSITLVIGLVMGLKLAGTSILTREDAEFVLGELNAIRAKAAAKLNISDDRIKTGILIDENHDTGEIRQRLMLAIDNDGDGCTDNLLTGDYNVHVISTSPPVPGRIFIEPYNWTQE